MTSPENAATLRSQTKAHYDRYPFGFDQEAILEEKLQHRVMGDAIRGLRKDALVMDVGCGACRVARLVQRTSGATTINVDLSTGTLRDARRRHDPGPLVNGDNLQLPFRDAVADLVISNGVIHCTPDPRASFLELARMVKPGGTLVVSVYDRHSWYYYTFRYAGALVRGLRALIGDRGLKVTVFPFFYVGVNVLLPLATRRMLFLPIETSWNLFHDQFTTPVCSFHTFEEMARWGDEARLVREELRREAAHQLATIRLRKPPTT